ncbi:MAG: glycosyltransferase family 4 protein [Bacteroidota bacterium]|jgi:glycosyltransferase involved in cell wall biosynthesis
MPDRPLKILVLNWQDITNPLAGGAEVHLHEVFERIASRGHEVTLFCHYFDGAPREEMRNGIRIIRQGGRALFNFHVPIAYFKRFRKERFDVIVDDVNKIPFYTPLFAREPVQGVTHHLFGKSIFLETIFPFAAYVYLSERLIKQVYRRVHFIIGSPSTHKEYLEWGFPKDQVTVVNYCVNKEVYYPDASNSYDIHRIGYFGRLKKYKSVDHLLQAFNRIRNEYPQLHLDIIGDGDDKKRLEDVASQLDLHDRVTFHGFIDERDKAPMLQLMNFVVNTSSKEGWGLTVVEANACGTPVVAANVPGLRDSVVDGQTGLLYEFGNIDDLVAKMRIFLDSIEQRNAFRARALAWAAKFDWEVATDETLAIIRRTIADWKS